jgi:ABC-type Na+ efflux pump permease subunit
LFVKLAGVAAFILLLFVLVALIYMGEFPSRSIDASRPLHAMSGFTDPIRNVIGRYGLLSILTGLLIAVCIAVWLYCKERREMNQFSSRDKKRPSLRYLATKLLPQYEADDGPLTAVQLRQIKKRVPQGAKRSVRSTLFETKS